ncbi:MAG: hypothetical protein LBT53_04810 [Puniceicoccales bacterium]|nr:hypothetical protein [Puniceicoccales bacterium]
MRSFSAKQFFTAAVLLAAILASAVWLRFERLGEKPLHSDEAVQAYKVGELLAGKGYRYDPGDHHGPVMYYASELVCEGAGQGSFAEMTADVLRAPQAFAGVVLVFLPLLLWRRRKATAAGGAGMLTGGGSGGGGGSAAFAGVGLVPVLAAAAFAATSPVAVYYSRYFIQETIFVACFWFAVVLIWRAAGNVAENGDWGGGGVGDGGVVGGRVSRRTLVLVASAGVLFGLAVALKETWPLMIAAAGAGTVAAVLLPRLFPKKFAEEGSSVATGQTATAALSATARVRAILRAAVLPTLVFGAVAVGVAELFFSSFGTNWQGVVNSVMAFFSYAGRAAGQGHEKPFGYYLPLLFDAKPLAFDVLSLFGARTYALRNGFGPPSGLRELFPALGCILALGMLPVKNVWRSGERQVAVFALTVGAALLLLYSLIAYKTPWLVVGILPAMWLAAGLGVATFGRWLAQGSRSVARVAGLTVAGVALAAVFLAQWKSAEFLSKRFPADAERNPLAYVHTTDGIGDIAKRAAQMAEFAPAGEAVFARVYAAEYWPLPWYLREWEFLDGRKRVGFWVNAESDPSPALDAPIVITDASTEEAVSKRLRETYTGPDFLSLRIGTMLYVRYRKDLMDKIAAKK